MAAHEPTARTVRGTLWPMLAQPNIRWLWHQAWAIVLLVCLSPQIAHAASHAAANHTPVGGLKSTPPIRPKVMCPEDVEQLTTAMLRDLPEYINRLSHQRGGSQAKKYVIVATKPNLTPLPVTTSAPAPKQGELHQVFFTVLERQYDTRQKTDSQNYYWLFLAQTPNYGWQLAILYTRSGSFPASDRDPSPLREATREVPGLAIRQWLRDCKAGAVYVPS